MKQDVVRAAKRSSPVSPVADSKDEHCDIMMNVKKRPRFSKINYDIITMAFAKALRMHIDGIVMSQCLGCMLNISYDRDGHDLCSDPAKYVEEFFEDAMTALADDQVRAIMDEQRKMYPKLPACPSKTILQADMQWCGHVKQTIINM